ncbi:methylenetetrahydrofolate dehydrogenase (NADP+) : methenyltetrahydrofolate cyclohydrolase [Oceanobacillus iheyensis HTE831]|uniref:Bifunctional protein FolD n=1 Tax=Oceanobacillus iheyensis (strain DSM 14371 / CIP 107618 / JCM 11309 / KCTC 3954 / HTE831) TaxID=221109 RepID=FOLD_OCEIH|nr:bifunctional methylenetetrahydrofolate dehydrogenase/methenyltetrahydrofolate cyclohydrolase FolD [Oceanobacillus iheyensis]Q8EQ43.1 RecName: Full=Bifunctional protein FolD; Includes: RecName: Full=Methylenetetrahydrofolate dehydrogenase; Includes: RecName: Full=Methenyltetrahydrofolate cyclohydrolase [Oceanobacillus iheyensis HTE831]BAC13836.1 methylenetetrahydrofolate dehydrogenase (NADP+) : methenyltetrahydrofolate cyclohydrolase [Oceanobacillus iheyensis HTE831]
MATLLNGKELSEELKQKMKIEVDELKEKGLTPHLTVILVGDNPASKSYVKGKEKACAVTGISSNLIELPENISQDELLQIIDEQNNDDSVHGILVQLPLPDQMDEQKIIHAISPAKDVDGFHPINVGKMMTGEDTFIPCTPYGILTMLRSKDISLEGKHAVIIGRSNIVGKPIGLLLLQENATVTYTHSRTKNLQEITKQADILIVAIGRAHAINADYIKEDAVVIDVGINRKDDGKLTGDVDFESAEQKASYITPVPRGVGPMTITMLLKNTIKAAKGLNDVER